jgi:hypothetical protein
MTTTVTLMEGDPITAVEGERSRSMAIFKQPRVDLLRSVELEVIYYE